jgi:hypothetical protein
MLWSIRIAAIAFLIFALPALPAEARRHCRYRRCCTCEWEQPASTVCVLASAAIATKPKVKLELTTVGEPRRDRIIVRISATNLGACPIVWDSEFATLLEWSMWIGTSPDYTATVNHDPVPHAEPPLTTGRFVTIRPEESVSKEIDLTKGVRTFVTGHGTITSPEGGFGHTPIAYEAILKFWIPEKSKTITVSTRYSELNLDGLGGDTFLMYFGKTLKDAGLPEGWFESNQLVIHISEP